MSRTRGTLLWIEVPGLGSRVVAQPYADAARTMRTCRAIVLPPCEAFGGRLAFTAGDSFHFVFRRAGHALLAAAAVQDRAAQHARSGGEKFDLRACAVSGEMRIDRNGVVGDLVDLAGRVRGAAGRGEVVLTGDVFAAIGRTPVTAEELADSDGVPADVRLYRLARARGSELPYGGIGLSKAGRLPQIGAQGMLEGGESPASRSWAQARAALRRAGPALASAPQWASHAFASLPALGRRASEAVPALRSVPARIRNLGHAAAVRLARIPRRVQLGAVAALAVAVAAGAAFVALRGDPLDRALSRHDFRAARRELKRVKDTPERAYDEARIQEARGSFGPAATGYVKAVQSGEKRGLQQLMKMTESRSCDARTNAARALGELGDPRAVRALQKLEKSKFADERQDAGVFRCSSKRAAREALEQLRSRSG